MTLGVSTQVPLSEHDSTTSHVPQLPPSPSGPQSLVPHTPTDALQLPCAVHTKS